MSQKDCVFLFQQNLLQDMVYCVATLFAEGLEGSPAIQEVDVAAIAGDSWDLRSHQHRLGVQNVLSIEWLPQHLIIQCICWGSFTFHVFPAYFQLSNLWKSKWHLHVMYKACFCNPSCKGSSGLGTVENEIAEHMTRFRRRVHVWDGWKWAASSSVNACSGFGRPVFPRFLTERSKLPNWKASAKHTLLIYEWLNKIRTQHRYCMWS